MIKKNTISLLAFTLVFISLGFISCGDYGYSCKTAKIRFTCTSSNPYDLWIDDVYKTEIPGNSYVEYDLTEGIHTFRYRQVSGYILYPTEGEYDITVSGCVDAEYIIP
jgi:hypothetical protein